MKYVIAILSLFIINDIQSQITQGATIVSGSINILSQNSSIEGSGTSLSEYENKSTQITLSPRMGKFISESVLIGGGIKYEHSTSRQEDFFLGDLVETQASSNIISITPYVEKYWSLGKDFYFNSQLSLEVGYGIENRDNGTESETVINIVASRLSPGLTYFISDKWAAHGGLGSIFFEWRSSEREDSSDSSTSRTSERTNYGLNANINTFNLGVTYLLNNQSTD